MSQSPIEDTPTLLKPDPAPVDAPTLDHVGSAGTELGPAPPGYQLLRELGRGGMAVVFLAQHLPLKRWVALKMILGGTNAGHERLSRLRTEAEAIARLRHPHLVQIYEVGEWQGQPYLALEYAAQGSLDKKMAGTPLPAREAARLAAAVADAIHVAHGQGIVHRDLKPANILLEVSSTDQLFASSQSSAAPADQDIPIQSCHPKITDFGLAKQLDSATGHTTTGAIVGTPSYMAPEQAGGELKKIGPWTDIYAIGAILYEMLTGRPPFKAATPIDTAMQVIHCDPVPPSQLQPKTPSDLETICLKCLQKEPRKRYASAADLAEDLRRFLNEEPILARPIGPVERMVKWVRRRPTIAALIALLFLTLASGLIISLWLYWDARFERDRAERFSEQYREQYQAAQEAKQQALRQAEAERRAGYAQRMMAAQFAWSVNNIAQVEQSLLESPKEYRSWEWHYLNKLIHGERFMRPAFRRMASSLDGRRLAYLSMKNLDMEAVFAAESDQPVDLNAPKKSLTLAVCDVEQEKDIAEFAIGHHMPQALALSPDGQIIAAVFNYPGDPLVDRTRELQCQLVMWDAATGRERHRLEKLPVPIYSLAFHPTKPLLACGHRWTDLPDPEKTVHLVSMLNLQSLQFEETFPAGRILQRLFPNMPPKSCEVRVVSLHFDLKGTVLTANQETSGGSQFICWPLTAPKPEPRMIFNVSPFFNAGSALLSGCIPEATGEIGYASIRSDRAFMFGRGRPRVFAFHLQDAARKNTWNLEHYDISSLCVEPIPNGRLAVACTDGAIHLLDSETGQIQKTLRGHVGEVRGLAFLEPTKSIASLGTDGTMRVWSLQEPPPIEGSGLAAAMTHLDPGEDLLISQIMGASQGMNPTIHMDRVNVSTRKRSTEFIIPNLDAFGGVTSLTFSSRGRFIALPVMEPTAADPRQPRGRGLQEIRDAGKAKLQVWDTHEKRLVFDFENKDWRRIVWMMGMLAVSDDGRWLAARQDLQPDNPANDALHEKSHIHLWSIGQAPAQKTLTLANVAVAFHPNAARLFVLEIQKQGADQPFLLRLHAIDCQTGQIERTWTHELPPIYGLLGHYNHLSISGDGKWAAASVMDMSYFQESSGVDKSTGMALRHLSAPIVVWDLENKSVRTFGGNGPTLFSPDQRRLVSSNRDGSALWLWDVQGESAQQPILTLKNEVGGRPFYLSFSANGRQLVMSPLTRVITRNQIQVWQGLPSTDDEK